MNRDRLEAIASAMMRGAQLNFRRDGYLKSVAIIIGDSGHPVIVTPETLRDAAEKEAYARTLAELCREKEAVAIIQLAESWAAPPERTSEALKWVEEHGSMADYPHRTEELTCMMETATDVTLWRAAIVREKGKKPTARPWQRTPLTQVTGRFSNMLGHLKN